MKKSLTKFQEEFIFGALLGDSSVDKRGRVFFGHSEKQKEYLFWKYEQLKDISINIYFCMSGKDSKYPQYRFNTNSLNIFKYLRFLLYRPKKRITRSYLNKLTPLSLAVWYMDDGSLSYNLDKKGNINSRRLYLCTESFDLKENEIIKKYFDKVWNIKFNVSNYTKKKTQKTYYRLSCGAIEAQKLFNIISPYVHDSMKYKLDMKYKNKINARLP